MDDRKCGGYKDIADWWRENADRQITVDFKFHGGGGEENDEPVVVVEPEIIAEALEVINQAIPEPTDDELRDVEKRLSSELKDFRENDLEDFQKKSLENSECTCYTSTRQEIATALPSQNLSTNQGNTA